MQVFIYEYVTSGGFLHDAEGSPPACLLREGAAMIDSLAADFAAIPGTQVSILRDDRWPERPRPADADPGTFDCYPVRSPGEESDLFDRLAARSDWTVVIAPELAGRLLDRCRRVAALGGRLLGPEPPVVEIASDKQHTAEYLAAAGVAVPLGVALQPGDLLPADFDYPAVLKPRWGAGSQAVRRIDRFPAERLPSVEIACPSRLERYYPGLPASVAFLCGPAGRFPLIPCRQCLSEDGRFDYLGGSLPLERALARRAVRLARAAVEALPEPTGYLGIDLVLGLDPGGAEDVVIEVNPRLTTSYVGLRAAAAEGVNLAAAMLDVRLGRQHRLSFQSIGLQFDPDGRVLRTPHAPREDARHVERDEYGSRDT
jgi:predicted ATP-grasp superfamily ATP-dependent carboligase